MNEQNKILTELATMKEQMRWLSQDLHELKTDVKNLNAFKFKTIGFAALAAIIVTSLVELARAKGL